MKSTQKALVRMGSLRLWHSQCSSLGVLRPRHLLANIYMELYKCKRLNTPTPPHRRLMRPAAPEPAFLHDLRYTCPLFFSFFMEGSLHRLRCPGGQEPLFFPVNPQHSVWHLVGAPEIFVELINKQIKYPIRYSSITSYVCGSIMYSSVILSSLFIYLAITHHPPTCPSICPALLITDPPAGPAPTAGPSSPQIVSRCRWSWWGT